MEANTSGHRSLHLPLHFLPRILDLIHFFEAKDWLFVFGAQKGSAVVGGVSVWCVRRDIEGVIGEIMDDNFEILFILLDIGS